jgi:hypothetical protein
MDAPIIKVSTVSGSTYEFQLDDPQQPLCKRVPERGQGQLLLLVRMPSISVGRSMLIETRTHGTISTTAVMGLEVTTAFIS